MRNAPSARPLISLEGEVVIVTGAGSANIPGAEDIWSIGAAIAAYAAGAGAKVGVLDIEAANAQRTIDRILAETPAAMCLPVAANVADVDQVKGAFEQVRSQFGAISGLVNNVGVGGPGGTAKNVDLESWTSAFDVNVTSMVITSRTAIDDLEQTKGSIVNISSAAGIRAGHHGLSYPTTKAAVVGLSATMAGHHGPEGVRVNTVAPGLAYTPMVVGRGLSQEGRATRAAASILGTEGTSWDIAGPVVFLLSRAASWVTGVTLPVDAGLTAMAPNLGVAKRND